MLNFEIFLAFKCQYKISSWPTIIAGNWTNFWEEKVGEIRECPLPLAQDNKRICGGLSDQRRSILQGGSSWRSALQLTTDFHSADSTRKEQVDVVFDSYNFGMQ